MEITLVDYGAGNLGSVDKAFQYIGAHVKIARTSEDIQAAKALVLPGVGAITDAMQKLKATGLVDAILNYINSDRPFLGICLGFQMLFEYSEEGGHVKGFGILPGSVRLFQSRKGLKVPQIGWNSIEIKGNCKLFQGLPDHSYVYFVHSYYAEAADRSVVSARCEHGTYFDAAIERGNVFGTQFHPEKSGAAGLQILRNFVEAVKS